MWVVHLRQNGFVVRTTEVPNIAEVKAQHKVPARLTSCHTALVGGYVIEGHVPASDILRLLKERPPILGLAVPGMPIGAPGMEGPNPEPYDVFAFDSEGQVTVFSSYRR